MEPRASIPLTNAHLCLDCDVVFEFSMNPFVGMCPKCAGQSALPLSRIILPLGRHLSDSKEEIRAHERSR